MSGIIKLYFVVFVIKKLYAMLAGNLLFKFSACAVRFYNGSISIILLAE